MAGEGADRSLAGKLRRRWARLGERRPAQGATPRALVSISFDDAPESAADAGARVLQARGVRGTYFLCAGLMGETGPMGRNADAAAVRRLLAEGHEVGCHTHSHINCGRATGEALTAEAQRNAAALAALGAPEPRAFAYPYGEVSMAAKRALGGRFGILRALHHGLVRQGADLNQAPAVGIEGPGGEAAAALWLERALAEGGWLILYTHDVGEAPSPFGCTPEALGRLVDRAIAGGAELVTVGEGARRLA